MPGLLVTIATLTLAGAAAKAPTAGPRTRPAHPACTWQTFAIPGLPAPNDPTHPAGIAHLAAVSAQDAWANGFWTNPRSGQQESMMLRWNGTSWTVVPSPVHGDGGVVAAAHGTAWLVGESASGALTLHWTGTTWVAVPNPSAGAGSSLMDVTIVAPDDVWAVGSNGSPLSGGPLVLHWNGARWGRVGGPDAGMAGLTGVAAIPGTAWVWIEGVDNTYGPSVALWTGKGWTRFPPPIGGVIGGGTMAAVSATSAWIATTASTAAGQNQTAMLHWDGAAWARVPTPNPGNNGELHGVAARSASDAWAVGAYLTTARTHHTRTYHAFVLHWDGARWSVVRAPRHDSLLVGNGFIGSSVPVGAGVALVPGTRAVWVFGGTLDLCRY